MKRYISILQMSELEHAMNRLAITPDANFDAETEESGSETNGSDMEMDMDAARRRKRRRHRRDEGRPASKRVRHDVEGLSYQK